MPNYFTQATIATTDNVAANYATNTWSVGALTDADLASWHANLSDFYQGIDVYFSSLVRSVGGLELTTYNRANPKPRVPIVTNLYTLSPGGTAPLPTEVSLCLSFQAAKASGLAQARRRGRVYLPFMDEAQNHTDGRPLTAMVSGIATQAAALLAASDANVNWGWEVWSTVNSAPATITDGWVDNEWDVQRRRGRVATARTTFT